MTARIYVGVRDNLENFDLNWRKKKGFTECSYLGLCVCSSAVVFFLLSRNPSMILDKKEKEKRQIIFLYNSSVVFLSLKMLIPTNYGLDSTPAVQ